MSSRNPALVLGIAGLGYLLAVSQRSTLGAAAITATERFHITGEQLAALAVVQLAVYAVMQIPVGILLDRFGSRKLLIVGGIAMAIGQFVVATASTFQVAGLGRLAVGFGDAFTFISLIRLINGWTTGAVAARWQQLLGNLGQLGQVVSAFPFAWLLHLSGWGSAFASWAGLSLIAVALFWFLIADERFEHQLENQRISLRQASAQLIQNVKDPQVRMAFWTHFITQSPGTVMVLLWGMPFLVKAEGLPRSTASLIMSSFVFVGVVISGGYGYLCSHLPNWRVPAVLGVVTLTMAYWVWVLSFSSKAPAIVLIGLFLILGISGPGSMLAFDFSRTSVPRARLGSANGFINIGGFLASFTMMYLIGLALDAHHANDPTEPLYSVEGFRTALISQFLVIGIGMLMFLREHRQVQRRHREPRE